VTIYKKCYVTEISSSNTEFLFQREGTHAHRHIRDFISSAGVLLPAMMVSAPSYFKEINVIAELTL
jgi:hypothetical protein